MNQVRLYGKPIRVNKASADKQKTVEVGAELFVGNLDPMVTEQVLYETFSRFGSLIAAPKVCPVCSLLSQCLERILTHGRSRETTTISPKATDSCPSLTSKLPTTPLPT